MAPSGPKTGAATPVVPSTASDTLTQRPVRLMELSFFRNCSILVTVPSGDIRTRLRQMPQNAWRVMIQGHHVGYISWDQFVVNRDRLTKNRTKAEEGQSLAREGLACCKACSSAGFADAALGSAMPEMTAPFRCINTFGNIVTLWHRARI